VEKHTDNSKKQKQTKQTPQKKTLDKIKKQWQKIERKQYKKQTTHIKQINITHKQQTHYNNNEKKNEQKQW